MPSQVERFAHLHVHSDASPKDGLGPVNKLVEYAKSVGFDAMAITDHGTLANSIAFSIACEKNGIKPILGVEAYVNVDGRTNHITLLADGDRGFSNLVKLQNIAHANERKVEFGIDDLIDHADGLICLTGCVSSPLQSMPIAEAVKLGARLKASFGYRLFAEIMFTSDLPESWERSVELSEKLGIGLVVTNDIHFAAPADARIHPLLTSIRAGYEFESKELWCKGYEHLSPLVTRFLGKERGESAMSRAWKISKKISKVNLKRSEQLPDIKDAHITLRKMIFDAFNKKFEAMTELPKAYSDRINFELETIERMGYSAYFIILEDIVRNARILGARVGTGRGSGAGSLILYLLNITELDPLLHELSFERFLNPQRKGMPDVDVDFDSEHRDVVIDYATKRWNAKPIAIYATWSHKTLVHDLVKQLKLSRDDEKMASENGPDSEAFRALCKSSPVFGQAYETMLGQIKNRGKHAGGVIITDAEVPLERIGGRQVAAWTEGFEKELSYAGIVKFDLLGVSALSALRRMEELLGFRAEPPTPNHPAFSLFTNGDLAGIFQFSGSAGIVELTRSVKPNTFEDLIAINALYRPGALDAGTAQRYVEWRKKPRKLHPIIDEVLAPTFGVIIYQEQVMEVYARVTGGSLAEGDSARRVIFKSKPGDAEWEKKMDELKSTFVDGAKSNGIEQKLAESLWHEIATHARYSFNKSHAACYSYMAWEMAWWKYEYPGIFYVAMLNTDRPEAQTYVFDAVRHGIKIVPPHVNYSSFEYEWRDEKIYMPIDQIKFLGENGAKAIVDERDARGEFPSLVEFRRRLTKRLVNSRACKGLWSIGGFDRIPGTLAEIGIEFELDEDTSKYSVQQEYLGVVIPDAALLDKVAKYNSAVGEKVRRLAGIVTDKKKKTSKWGDYTVYYLAPEGTFWSREHHDIKVGQLVKVTASPSTGRAKTVMEM